MTKIKYFLFSPFSINATQFEKKVRTLGEANERKRKRRGFTNEANNFSKQKLENLKKLSFYNLPTFHNGSGVE